MNSLDSASRSAWFMSAAWQRLGLLILLLIPAASCTEGMSGPFAPGGDRVQIALAPRYHVVSSTGGVIDNARLTVLSVPEGDTLFRTVQPLDASAGTLTFELKFQLPAGVAFADVLVLVEFLAGTTVEWSGRTPPMTVRPSGNAAPSPVEMFQGPPENLDAQDVRIDGLPLLLTEGDSARLNAQVTPAGRGRVFWSSTDTSIATVSPTGMVRTRRDGQVRIRAEAGPRAGFMDVVVRQRPASVRITPDSTNIGSVGQSATVAASVLDPRGNPIDGATVTWSTQHPAVLQSNGDGRFTAVANGAATIVATSATHPNVSGTARVIVAQQPMTISFAAEDVLLTAIGETRRLEPRAVDARGNPVSSAVYSWESNAPAIATVDAAGNVRALANGKARITARFPATGASASLQVTVTQVLHTINIEPAALTLSALGDTARLRATPQDRNGNAMTAAVSWSSSEPATVTVDQDGLLRAVRPGSARIEASSGGTRGGITVTVAPVVFQLQIVPAVDTLRSIGATRKFSARGIDRNQNVVEVTPAWSVADASVADIDAQGIVTARSAGSTTVAARYGDVQATATLVVAPRPQVRISPDTLLLNTTFATARFSATVDDGTGRPLTVPIVWRSLQPTVAIADTAGVVTALNRGIAQIVATAGASEDTAVVIFEPVATRLRITPAADTVAIGNVVRFGGSVLDAAGVEIGGDVAWSVAPGEIASITQDGALTALAAGEAVITATSGTLSATATVRVIGGGIDLLIANLSVLPRDSVRVGDSITVAVSVRNQGSQPSPATTLRARAIDLANGIAFNQTIVYVPAIPAGATVTGGASLYINPDLNWPSSIRVGVMIDSINVVAETDETNNTALSAPLRITTGVVVPPAGLPAEVLMHEGEVLNLDARLPGATWTVIGTPYPEAITLSVAGVVNALRTGSATVVGQSATAVDTVVVWVVPQGSYRTWVGHLSPDASWTNPANWSPAGVPTPTETLFIPDCIRYLIECSYPVLTGDTEVTTVLTGAVDWYDSPPPGSAVVLDAYRQFQQWRSQLRSGTRPSVLASMQERSARRRQTPAPLFQAQLQSNWLHIDLNGHVLTIMGNMPDAISIGAEELPGKVLIAGTAQLLESTEIDGDVSITGNGAQLDQVIVNGNLLVTGSATLSATVEGDLEVMGAVTVEDNTVVGRNALITGTLTGSQASFIAYDTIMVNGPGARIDMIDGYTRAGHDVWGPTEIPSYVGGFVFTQGATISLTGGSGLSSLGGLEVTGGATLALEGYGEVQTTARTASGGVITVGLESILAVNDTFSLQGGLSSFADGVLELGGSFLVAETAIVGRVGELMLTGSKEQVIDLPVQPVELIISNPMGVLLRRDLDVDTLDIYNSIIRAESAHHIRAVNAELGSSSFHNLWLDVGSDSAAYLSLDQLTFTYDASVFVPQQLRVQIPIDRTMLTVAGLVFDGMKASGTPPAFAEFNSSLGTAATVQLLNPSAPPYSVLSPSNFRGTASISLGAW